MMHLLFMYKTLSAVMLNDKENSLYFQSLQVEYDRISWMKQK
ncbi:hypothetical protein CHCC20335_1257 [Bacillus paralicheniformis]|nr:hypothetical protein CHCC20335_1257 [Bacillus paralicheniformis]